MNKTISENLNIRYLKLHFFIQFHEESHVYRHKPSALRGGIGNVLLNKYCLKDQKCVSCNFKGDCIAHQILYGKFQIKPPSVTEGESIGYVIECEDYRERILSRGILRFQMLLFGNTISYWRMIVEAVEELGKMGLCHVDSKFRLIKVTNTAGDIIYREGDFFPKLAEVRTVREYVDSRIGSFKDTRIIFRTNTNITYHGEMLMQMQEKPLMAAISRRIFFLNCYEGIETKPVKMIIPEIIDQDMKFGENRRYSNRTETAMYLKGIRGRVDFDDIDDDTYAMMLAGELVHIGKDTSFGSGRYTMEQLPEEEKKSAIMKKNRTFLTLHEV